ncbi:spore germination protein (amino acid permease) [Paenibacillus algorifonticola]|uniref:Spore germination protein (Amino acid permease) n=1 Tax=Paenibacillus algorifonticola TaxID=684063 RepID=A0A1I1Z766_9BACL|nr:endospore germination permease [Paenibacillus algorifonticola]SFE27128.1 spore germination protein (amino acid permease) [Paenibacillus algorifonticola]
MVKTLHKVSFLQICMILMMTVGLMNHVIVNPLILDASGRDAWISVLLAGILFLPWCFLLVLFMKKSGQQKLHPWLASKTNPFIAWLMIIPICLQLLFIGGFTLIDTVRWATTNYMPGTPRSALIITLCLVCCYFAISGIRMIAIAAGIMLPIVIVLGYFVAIANTPEKDYRLLQPVLENGWQPAIHGMIYVGGGFVEIIMVLAIQHRIKSRVKAWQLLILAVLLIYITLGPIIGGITEFGHIEAAKQMESPFEQWRLVKFGNIEHVDFLSEFQWLSGAVIRTSFAMFLLGELIPFRKKKATRQLIQLLTLGYILLGFIPINGYSSYLWLYHYYFPVTLATVLVLSALFIAIALLKRQRKGSLA